MEDKSPGLGNKGDCQVNIDLCTRMLRLSCAEEASLRLYLASLPVLEMLTVPTRGKGGTREAPKLALHSASNGIFGIATVICLSIECTQLQEGREDPSAAEPPTPPSPSPCLLFSELLLFQLPGYVWIINLCAMWLPGSPPIRAHYISI